MVHQKRDGSNRSSLDGGPSGRRRFPTDAQDLIDTDSDLLTHRIATSIRALMWLERWTAVLMLVLLLVTMSAQVIARYVFRAPFSWSEEFSRFAMIWMAFMAAAYVMAGRGHITVDLLAGGFGTWRLPKSLQLGWDCLVHAIVAAICLLLLLGSLRFVWHVYPVGSPSLGISKSIWYGAVSVGFGLMAIHSLLNLILLIRTGNAFYCSGFSRESET